MLSELTVPFARNRYFYGKLLTAQDFQAEQRYLNHKRRLINRRLFGSGVVHGLDVLPVDELSIAVGAGLALDDAGRELALPHDVVCKLSALEGFDALLRAADRTQKTTEAYLCLRYHEHAVQPVHAVLSGPLEDETQGPECNLLEEGYTLYLTSTAPALPEGCARAALTVYQDDEVRITLAAPRFASWHEPFALELCVSKKADCRPLALSLEGTLHFLSAEGGRAFQFELEEPEEARAARYTLRLPLSAQQSAPANGVITPGTLTLRLGGQTVTHALSGALEVKLCDGAERALLDELRTNPAHHQVDLAPLCLARLNLILMEEFYAIDGIDQLPFGQQVLTGAGIQALEHQRAFSPRVYPAPSTPAAPDGGEAAAFSEGTVEVSIPAGAKKGAVLVSQPIPHRLGPGAARLSAALCDGEQLLFGGGAALGKPFTWGISLDSQNGLVQLRVKLAKAVPPATLRFAWTAELKQAAPQSAPADRLELQPGVSYVAPGGLVTLEVLRNGCAVPAENFDWSLDADGGCSIDAHGRFLAGAAPGVYLVKATLDARAATAFVVVK